MIKQLPTAAAMALAVFVLKGQSPADWENPAVFQRNQVRPHATLMPYANLTQAIEGRRKESPYHLALNGTWKFHWSENPSDAPVGFQEDSYVRGGWHDIRVPSNWQMEGFGYPVFRNVGLPHPGDPPEVPEAFNPTGCYYRTFHLPAYWKDRQVFLHFEGVQSASYVWVNGKEAGYNQGGMEPAEYDITRLLRPGENSIAVMVLRYCDGSYLEDQDTWRLSGIFRDVYLMAAPRVHVRDFQVVTDLDGEYRDATLKLGAEVCHYGSGAARGHVIEVALYGPDGLLHELGGGALPIGALRSGSAEEVHGAWQVNNPLKWSAEYPNLYTLVISLKDGQGNTVEYLSCRVGFRELEVLGQAFLVNGVPVKFNGVNSHMMHPLTGHAMDQETMHTDLVTMKRFNINCVRTSHYPPNVEYLDLADELGLYIVDETGDEAHAYTYLSSLPEWRAQYLDRMRKMVYRDRNHPSVVIWSAGNESGPGDNICALMEEGRRIDPSRPAWLYGGNRDEDPATNPIRCEDIVGPRYLQPSRLQQRFGKSKDPRPSFMDEYIAATGNSLGGLDDYWELIRRYPRLTGGAIWDWISPGISMPVVATTDDSPENNLCVFMTRAGLVPGKFGQALHLSGHDDWLEVYRDPSLDISGEALTISFWVKPGPYNGNMAFLTKGDNQYGIIQQDREHLEFYLHTGQRKSVSTRLPDGWEGTWHHVAGIYDGRKMELYVDGKMAGTQSCRGRIVHTPFPVLLGNSAQMNDSHRGYLCHADLDRVRIFDCAVEPEELLSEQEPLMRARSKLWLDFETSQQTGTFWFTGIRGRTYGLVWPDRTVQPELWQLKKSPQPVTVEAVDPEKGTYRIANRHHFRNLEELQTRWQLTEDGTVISEGDLEPAIPAGHEEVVRVPYDRPEIKPGRTYHLLLSFRTRESRTWAPAGHEVAWEQIEFPWHSEAASIRRPQMESAAGDAVHPALVMEGDAERVDFSGEGFRYRFDRGTGRLSSMVIGGKELLEQGPVFNVWRAPLANDRDGWNAWHTEMGYERDWMGRETANGWYSLGLDRLVQDVDVFRSFMDGDSGHVVVEATLHAGNHATAYKVVYRYTIGPSGDLLLCTEASPRGYQPRWLPKMGLQMLLPAAYNQMEWLGRGPFETYPDRKTGAKIGLYRTTADAAYVPYIIPQDYGNRTDVHWLKITDQEGTGFLVRGGELFQASLQKYTTGNLDRAWHTFQLQESDLLTLNLDHRVSGVGCTAMSVLNPYRVFPGETKFTFRITPVSAGAGQTD